MNAIENYSTTPFDYDQITLPLVVSSPLAPAA